MGNEYTQQQVRLINQMHNLWVQHVYWTRFFIISTAADLEDLEPVTKRLLRNPEDFAAALMPFYGVKISDSFKFLFTQHLLLAAELVNAAKNNEMEKVNDARKRWYKNADEIACFLDGINFFWNIKKWKNMLYAHLQMTEREAVLRLNGSYEEDIQVFNSIEEEALEMADYMSAGIIRQFCP